MRMAARHSLGLLVLAAVLAGCGGGHAKARPHISVPPARKVISWPAPSNPLARARAAGLAPKTHEFFAYHVHAHLDVFLNGKTVRIPAGIGMNIHDPGVHSIPASDGTTSYGRISPPCAKPCISPLHTHDVSGILHTESQRSQPNRLGEFFVEWGVRLSKRCVATYCKPKTPIAVYVDGKAFTGDPRTIALTNLKEIAIVIGSPPSSIPSTFPQ
jgi:hypothetical protein